MTTATASAVWEQIPPLPEPNGGFVCAALDGKVVVIGGTNWRDNQKRWLDVIWSFDPKKKIWETQRNLPHALAYPVVGEWHNELIIAGGTDGVRAHREVYSLKPSGKLGVIGKLQADRTLAVGGVIDGNLLVLGGTPDATKFDVAHHDGEAFDLRKHNSASVAMRSNLVFNISGGAVVGEELFIFGGGRYDATKELVDLDTAWAFNFEKGQWRSLKTYPFTVRGATAAKLDNQHILVAGGYGGEPAGFRGDTYVYDIRRDTYTKAMDLPVPALVGLVSVGDYVYCLGGEDKMKHRTDICARIRIKELLDSAK